MKTYRIIHIIAVVALIAAIQSCSDAPTTIEESEPETSENQTQVQRKTSDDTSAIQCSGVVSVPAKFHISVHAKINGIIRGINVTEGQQVKKGQVLARIEHQEIIRLQEDLLKSRAEYRYQKEEFERKKTLFQGGAISEKEFHQSESAYEASKAGYESLLQQASMIGISENSLLKNGIIRSVPVLAESTGVISHIEINEGSFVSQNSPILGMVNPVEKRLELEVFVGDANRLHQGQKIQFRVAGSNDNYETRIAWINAATEMEKHSIRVTSEQLPDAIPLIVGSRVFAEIGD